MDLRQSIFEARIISHASVRYYSALSDGYGIFAKALQLVTLLLSSGTVLALISKWPPICALIAALAVTAASLVQTVFAPALRAVEASGATKFWKRRCAQWEAMWLELNEHPDNVTFERFKAEQARDVEFEEPPLKYWRNLSTRVQNEAVRTLT